MAFKKFGKEDLSGFTQVKASVARGIRCKCEVASCCCSSNSSPVAIHSRAVALTDCYTGHMVWLPCVSRRLMVHCCSEYRRAVSLAVRHRRAGCAVPKEEGGVCRQDVSPRRFWRGGAAGARGRNSAATLIGCTYNMHSNDSDPLRASTQELC